MNTHLAAIIALCIVVLFGGIVACSSTGSAAAEAVLAKINTVIAAATPIAAKLGAQAAQAYVTANAAKYGLTAEEVTAINSGISSLADTLAASTTSSSTTTSAASTTAAVADKEIKDARWLTPEARKTILAKVKAQLKI